MDQEKILPEGGSEQSILKKFDRRQHQVDAKKQIFEVFEQWFDGTLKRQEKVDFPTAALLEMATGTGKTKTIGDFIAIVTKMRNRYFAGSDDHKLNVLVLNNRIDLINQLREDFFVGKDGKQSILPEDVKSSFDIHTYHSKIKKTKNQLLDTLNTSGQEIIEDDFVKHQGDLNGDEFHFGTFQTVENMTDQIFPNIIFIDEADIVSPGKDFYQTLVKLYRPDKFGRMPFIIPETATPDDKTFEIFGDPVYKFGLAMYLASDFAPKLNYQFMRNNAITEKEVQELWIRVKDAQSITNYKDKKTELGKIKEEVEILSGRDDDPDKMLADLFVNIEPTEKTLIFAKSIAEADEISQKINAHYGKSVARSFHSKADNEKVFEEFKDEKSETKIIVAVDMLNRGIDMPEIENIVLRRMTDSPKIFFQQLGRALRGKDKKIKCLDYAGNMKNFVWLDSIVTEIKDIQESREKNEKEKRGEKFEDKEIIDGLRNLGDDFPVTVNLPSNLLGSQINIQEICSQIVTIEKTENEKKPLEAMREQLAELKITDAYSLIKFGPVKFKKEFGVSFLGKILGKILQYITSQELNELADKLGREGYNSPAAEMLSQLIEIEVTDRKSLLKFGPVKFVKKFGKSLLGKITERTLKDITSQELNELADKLGREGYNSPAAEMLSQLIEIEARDRSSLLRFGPNKFIKKFGYALLGKILERKIQRITTKELNELADKLGREHLEKKYNSPAAEMLAQLIEIEVRDRSSLLRFGPNKFYKEFGKSLIGKVLDRTIRTVITKDLNELADKLGWE